MEYIKLILKITFLLTIIFLYFKKYENKRLNKLKSFDLILIILISYLLIKEISINKSFIISIILIIILLLFKILTNKNINLKDYINKNNQNKMFFLIYNNKLNYKELNKLNKDQAWLENNLETSLDTISFCFYTNNKFYIIKKPS